MLTLVEMIDDSFMMNRVNVTLPENGLPAKPIGPISFQSDTDIQVNHNEMQIARKGKLL